MPTCSRTTCSSQGSRVTGLIDFYFACDDLLAYDLAICLNAWCFEPDRAFNITKARPLLRGYRAGAPLTGPSWRRCRCSAAARRCASC